MGFCLARGVVCTVVIKPAVARIADLLVESDVPFERRSLERAALEYMYAEAPMAGVEAATAAVDAVLGLGPLEPLLRDPTVSDVLVNGPGDIWVERAGVLERTDVSFGDDDAVVAAVERTIAPLGLRIDLASPSVDARLADGSRLHAVIPPVAIDGPVVAVRRFTQAVPDLEALVVAGAIDDAGAELLRNAVLDRRNIVVAGSTGAGKTTLLNILSREIPPDERVVTVEDAAELDLSGHVVRLEARPPNIEGVGAVTLRDLVRHSLRLRPDRIVVGEVRGPEALDMIQAMSTGHEGSMSTVHANSPQEALWRIETLALSGDLRVAEQTIRRQLLAAIGVVVQVQRAPNGRRVRSIAEIVDGEVLEVYPC